MTSQQLRDLADEIDKGLARVTYANRDIVVEDRYLGYELCQGLRHHKYKTTHARVSIEIEVTGPVMTESPYSGERQ